MTEGAGVPVAWGVTAGQVNEGPVSRPLLRSLWVWHGRVWFKKLAGDKAYSSTSLRRWLKKRGTRPVIPEPASRAVAGRPPPPLDRRAYRKRNVIERAVGWLKERRRIATRFEKLAVNFVTMITIGVIEKYSRVLLPNTP